MPFSPEQIQTFTWLIPRPSLLSLALIVLFANRSKILSHTIAIGLMVDGSVVVVENAFLQLGRQAKSGESSTRVILRAVVEVATPVIFGVGVIILVFFTFYVSSGMVAGGVFFEGAFGWDYRSGMLLVAAVTY